MNRMLVLITAVALPACASVVSGDKQKVTVKTNVAPATCELKNDKGVWALYETPGEVEITRAYSDLAVKCKQGELQGAKTVSSSTVGMAFGNIILGGGIGAGVDMYTGAAYAYPDSVTVVMKKPE